MCAVRAVDAVRVVDYDVYSSGDVFQNNGVVDTNPAFSMANSLYTLTLSMEASQPHPPLPLLP